MFKPFLCHFCVCLDRTFVFPAIKQVKQWKLSAFNISLGKKIFGQYLYTGKIFYFSKRGFPLTHTGYQKIINLQLLWMVWHWHWIYDIWRKTIPRTLTKYKSGAPVTEWNVATWYIFSICPGQLNNTDIDCPLVLGLSQFKMIAYWTSQSDPRH